MDISDEFSDRTACLEGIGLVRKKWAGRPTEEEWAGIFKVLSLIMFYCPEDVSHVVESAIGEAMIRHAHAESRQCNSFEDVQRVMEYSSL